MICPYRKNKIYNRNMLNGEIQEEKELFAECEEEKCPFYYKNDRGAYPIEECKRALSELKG